MIVVGERDEEGGGAPGTKLHASVLVPCVTLFFPPRVEAHPWSHMVELDLLHKRRPLQQPPRLLPSTFFSTYTCGENSCDDIGGGQWEFVVEMFTSSRLGPSNVQLCRNPVTPLTDLVQMAGSWVFFMPPLASIELLLFIN